MSALDREILAERLSSVERHLKRVRECLPKTEQEFTPVSNASDSVILHLWQAIQLVIDTSLSAAVHFNLGSPISYADSFLKLGESGYIDKDLSIRLSHAAGFRNRIVHAYEDLDMQKIFLIAQTGPQDLRTFLAAIAKKI